MTNPSASGAEPPSLRGQLALALQETITAIVRLRSGRQMAADAEAFRAQIKQVMGASEQEARRMGYAGEDVRVALYAVVAFLDESVLNSQQPMFRDWPRKPLQDELFGGHIGGEIFFENLQRLLQRPDSEALADLLEVYELCLLLGFHGRYGSTESGELRSLIAQVGEKIARIRGGFGALAPAWAPPSAGDVVVQHRDPWLRRLALGAGSAFAVAAILFAVYLVSLRSGVGAVRHVASQGAVAR